MSGIVNALYRVRKEGAIPDNCEYCGCSGNLFFDDIFNMWICYECCLKIDEARDRGESSEQVQDVAEMEKHGFKIGIVRA